MANIWKPKPEVDTISILKQETHLKPEPFPCLVTDLKPEVLLKMSELLNIAPHENEI